MLSGMKSILYWLLPITSIFIIFANGQRPNLNPPKCTNNRIDIGLIFESEIMNIFRNNRECTEELLTNNRFIDYCVNLPNIDISDDFKFKLCGSSSLGTFNRFKYTGMKFQDFFDILFESVPNHFKWKTLETQPVQKSLELIKRNCKQLENQFYGSEYYLSDCTSEFNSNASNSSFYLQFYKEKTQILDFGVRLSIKLTGDILSISEFSKFTEIYKNVTDPPYLVVKFASNSTTINDNLQFINDVATLDIKNFKNERLVFTLYRIFQSINIFYNIDEEISIEMDSSLLSTGGPVQYNDVDKDKGIVYTFTPRNSDSIMSISKPFYFKNQINTGNPCGPNDLPCLSNLSQDAIDSFESDTLITAQNELVSNINNFSRLANTEAQYRVNLASDVLLKISNRKQEKETEDVVSSYLESINAVLDQTTDLLISSQNEFNSSMKFITGVERIIKKVELKSGVTSFVRQFPNIRSQVNFLNQSQKSIGIKSDITAGFYNTQAVNNYIVKGNDAKVSFLIFENSKLFVTDKVASDSSSLSCDATQVISNNVVSISPIEGIDQSEGLVTTIFNQQSYETNCTKIPRTKRVLNYKCVFWEVEKRIWNDYGCVYEKNITEGQIFHYCKCNHTTNFALLMIADTFPFCDWCEEVLHYVSLIGVFLSILGLSITIIYDLCITFLPGSKVESTNQLSRAKFVFKQYSEMSNQFLRIITTWCISLLIMNGAYIAFTFFDFNGAEIDEMKTSQRNSCIIIGVFLHFFLIASFCFALCISIVQYFIFYKSFKIFKFIYLKAVMFSLIIPSIAITIVLVLDTNAYINTNKYCWLKPEFSIYAAIIPIGVIMFVNIVFFLVISINYSRMIRKREKYVHVKQDIEEGFKKGINKEIVLILTCFVNSTITWIFGFLVTIPGNADWIYIKFVYALIFCILNSTQGFQIFIVYILISRSRADILKFKLQLVVKELKIKLKDELKKKQNKSND